jgi:hypothetical protein
MKRAYLLIYNDRLGSRETISSALNAMSEVKLWRYDVPHTFYLISEEDAKTLAKSLRKRLGAGRFLITEITSNKGGWLPKETWHLLKSKSRKTKE